MLFNKKLLFALVAAFIVQDCVVLAEVQFEDFEVASFPIQGYLGCQNSDNAKCSSYPTTDATDPVTGISYCSAGGGLLGGCQKSTNCGWCTYNEVTDPINNPKRQLDANIVLKPSWAVGFDGQCLQISNAVWAGSFAAHPFTPSLEYAAGESDAYNLKSTNSASYSRTRKPPGAWNRNFKASFDFVSLEPNAQQPNLKLEIAPTCGDDVRMGQVIITDEYDGLKVTYTGMDSNGASVTDTIASGLDRALTYTLTITMNFVDGKDNDTVAVELVKKHGSRRRRLEQSEETLYQVKGRGVRQLLEKEQSHREMKGKSKTPSKKPSRKPSRKPSLAPSSKPSLAPSLKPSSKPSLKPSLKPSSKPSLKPSLKPSTQPSRKIYSKTDLKSWEGYYYNFQAVDGIFYSRPVDSLMFRVASTVTFSSCTSATCAPSGTPTLKWTCPTFPGYLPLLGKGFCIDNVHWETYNTP